VLSSVGWFGVALVVLLVMVLARRAADVDTALALCRVVETLLGSRCRSARCRERPASCWASAPGGAW
jgi:hypothetical protein